MFPASWFSSQLEREANKGENEWNKNLGCFQGALGSEPYAHIWTGTEMGAWPWVSDTQGCRTAVTSLVIPLCGARYDSTALPPSLFFFFFKWHRACSHLALAGLELISSQGWSSTSDSPSQVLALHTWATMPSLWSAGNQTQAPVDATPTLYLRNGSPAFSLSLKQYSRTSVSVAFWFERPNAPGFELLDLRFSSCTGFLRLPKQNTLRWLNSRTLFSSQYQSLKSISQCW